MNKKRFLVFLVIIICIITLVTIFFAMINREDTKVSLLTANGEEEVNLYYYRAVPGLKMAEEMGLVHPVNKRIDLSGHNAKLNIDRIWYNNQNIVIFYHIEDLTQVIYLGGDVYLPSNEPIKKTNFWGSHTIGGINEKGIIYGQDFYSCLTLPLLNDKSGKPLSELDVLTFKPILTIPSIDKSNKKESIQLKAFEIDLKYRSDEETVVKIPIQDQIEIDDKRISFYQVDITPSICRIYFQYLNSSKDKVYRVKGKYTTDKGEINSFDVYPTVITDYPYHYYIEVPPFHESPDDIQLLIESLSCIGGDNVSFEIDTNLYTKKKAVYDVEIGYNSIKNTDLGINKILLDQFNAQVSIDYTISNQLTKPYTRLELKSPLWQPDGDKQSTQSKNGNLLTVNDGDFKYYDLDKWAYGVATQPGEGINISLSREFWDGAGNITIHLSNLTYIYEIDREIKIKLKY